jgi:transposase
LEPCPSALCELVQGGSAPIASEALTRIAAFYRIEGEIRGRSAEERRAVRQQRSWPLVEALQRWLREKLSLISQKTKLAHAIRYALSRWAGLCLFLEDGRIEIDNNVVERAIRPIALTRKNALFAGSDGGAEHWAVIASLIESCKLLGIEPHGYLADVIRPHRERLPPEPPRRSPALGILAHASAADRGLTTAPTA